MRVRRDGTRLGQHLAALDVFTLGAAQQDAHVVARLALVQQLAEHFHAGADGLLRGLDAHDLDFVAHLDDAALDPARHHGAATGDGEHVFHRHQEGAIDRTLGRGDVAVQRVSELHDGLLAELALVAFHGQLGAALDDGGVVTGELVLGEQLAHFHFHELQQLGIVDHVALVHEDDDVGHAHLARQQDVLARLRHRAVSRGHDQDGAVHLRGARDHVLHVVGVARAVDMRVVALGRRVLHVARRDRQDLRCVPPPLRFGGLGDLVIAHVRAEALVGRDFRQRRGQGRLAVIDVPDRADVYVRLVALEFCLCHELSWFQVSGVGCQGC